MKNTLFLIIAVVVLGTFIASVSKPKHSVVVNSIVYGQEEVLVSFEVKKGDVIRVCDGIGSECNEADLIQSVGHISVVQ